MQISVIIIHPIFGSALADENGSYWVDGPVCKKPKLTTGGGDNYNAGFLTGYMNGCSLEESLATAACVSGFYVRNARPPTV